MQAKSRRKRSQWKYHTHPIVELPLVEYDRQCCSAQVFCHFSCILLLVVVFFCIAIILFKTLRQLLEPNSGTNSKNYPVLDTVPVELPCWNSPWPRGAVLQDPGILHYLCMFLQLIAFFEVNIYLLQLFFAHFGVKRSRLYKKKVL